jgi:hypothetical protein
MLIADPLDTLHGHPAQSEQNRSTRSILGGFVAALLAIPTAAAVQTVIRELWQETAPDSSSPSGNGNLSDCSCRARVCFL